MEKIFLIYCYNVSSFILTKTYYDNSETKENLLLNCKTSLLVKAIEMSKEYRNKNLKNISIACGNSIY